MARQPRGVGLKLVFVLWVALVPIALAILPRSSPYDEYNQGLVWLLLVGIGGWWTLTFLEADRAAGKETKSGLESRECNIPSPKVASQPHAAATPASAAETIEQPVRRAPSAGKLQPPAQTPDKFRRKGF